MSAFTPPALDERLQAIGPTNRLPDLLRRTLEPRADFAPLPQPRPSDWLANHPSRGRALPTSSAPRTPTGPPASQAVSAAAGRVHRQRQSSLAQLQTFAAAFFALEVNVLPVLDIAGSG